MIYFTKIIAIVLLILASSSTYKKTLLSKLGLKFSTAAPNIDETPQINETPEQLVYRLSVEKAQKVAKTHNGLIIATDQVAVLAGQILSKPHTHQNAVKQLQQSSGKTVTFLTSLTLLDTDSQQLQTIVEPFKVIFKTLTQQQIEQYLRVEKPYQCAGSFKSEALGIALFERLEGFDPNTLIGLPLIQLVKMLKNQGIDVLADTPIS